MKEAKPAAMLPKPGMEEFRWMVYAVAIQDLFKTPTKSPVSFSQSLNLSLVLSHSSPLLYVRVSLSSFILYVRVSLSSFILYVRVSLRASKFNLINSFFQFFYPLRARFSEFFYPLRARFSEFFYPLRARFSEIMGGIKYQVVLTADLEGIQELRPADGWGSIKSCKLKLRCGYCNKVKWEEVHLGRRVPLTSRRKPIRIIKCDDCPRKAEVFIHEIYGTCEGKETSMLLLQADGMQPEDDFFLATCDFCAVDMDGTVSRSFDLVIEAGVQNGFEPDFPDGGCGGLISKMSVSFRRL